MTEYQLRYVERNGKIEAVLVEKSNSNTEWSNSNIIMRNRGEGDQYEIGISMQSDYSEKTNNRKKRTQNSEWSEDDGGLVGMFAAPIKSLMRIITMPIIAFNPEEEEKE